MWKYWLAGLVIIVIGGIAYYGLSPLFITITLDEDLPDSPGNEITVSAGAEVIGTTGHPASGTAHIVQDGDKRFLRYENFNTINGPDLFVYLATDTAATEFVNLGTLKATEGNVNYEIPSDIDVSKYHYALVWCRAFGVLFNSADLNVI